MTWGCVLHATCTETNSSPQLCDLEDDEEIITWHSPGWPANSQLWRRSVQPMKKTHADLWCQASKGALHSTGSTTLPSCCQLTAHRIALRLRGATQTAVSSGPAQSTGNVRLAWAAACSASSTIWQLTTCSRAAAEMMWVSQTGL